MKTCAFTGHRPKGLGYPESDGRCTALKEKLRSLIIRMMEEEGVTHFISGMAQGVDMYAAEIVLELKEKYPQITLECAIPYEGRRYGGRKPCETATSPSQSGVTRRRCCSGSPSGTGQTVWYARETGKPVWIIRPNTLEVE